MRILRLDLRAFGPFTDVTLNLEAGDCGLHIIYGPNEAGKSATLRALRQFFYGIEERTTDAFRHPYERLRIGARIRHSDGSIVEGIRRKARGNALRGPDDKAVVADKDLARLLAGVDEASFKTMFGIDHKTLVDGGQEIVKGGGQVGQLLFAAGAGITGLRSVQEGLQTDIGALFRPAGRTQRINKALSDLRDAQVAVKRKQLSADEWAAHDRDLNEAEHQKKEAESERQAKSRELHRLTRIRDALLPIARRKELLAELAEYRDAALLSAAFPEKRHSAMETLRIAENQSKQADLELKQIDEELRKLDVPEALLEEVDGIEDLHRRLGEYQKDMKDRPVRVVQGKNLEHEAKEILRSLGRPAELEQAENVRLRVDEPLNIRNLGTQQEGLVNRCESACQTRDDLLSRIEQAKEKLAELAAPLDPADLRRLIREVQNEGPLEEQLAAEQHKARQAEKQIAIDLARLPLWSGPQETLEQLALPAAETIDRFENDLNQLQSTRGQLADRVREVENRLGELDGLIEQLEREQAVPAEDDLQQARQLRDAGWRMVRGVWLDQSAEGPETGQFLAKFPPAANLAEAYERSVGSADLVADRLRREADRVASKAKLVADHGQRIDQLDKLTNQLRESTERLTANEGQWTALWTPLGIHPLPPREMRAWVRKHGELARQVQAARKQDEQAKSLEARIETQSRQLGLCMKKLGEPDAGSEETLVARVQRSQDVVDRFDRVKRERETLEREIAGHTKELPGAETRAGQATTELTRWQEQWAAAMNRLGLEATASAAQANAVLDGITRLFQTLHEADGFRRRIEGMDRDAAQFQADLQEMVQNVAPELVSLEVEASERELHSRLQRARAAQQSRQHQLNQREKEAGKLRDAQKSLDETRSQLGAMCLEAGCAIHEELPRAEQRAARRQQLENEIRQRDEHLLTLSAGASLDEFIADAARVDADTIDAAIEALCKQLSNLSTAISRLDQSIGKERTLLAGMNDNAAASEAAEDAQNLLAQLQTDVEHYAALRLAAVVLQEGIERFRKKYQGPVLARAGQLFADLTAGSFESLQIDYDDAGQPILLGVRKGDRETVGVAGMSDGSCDQLYLALRIASLEAYLETHEAIPFILDDILLNFDNQRAVAALRALAELSRRTQVVFFTHHNHLVEMAQSCLEGDVLFIHQLPGRTLPPEDQLETEVV